jgi:imidazolonepropionase
VSDQTDRARLLVRDLGQVATPAGTATPLRGPALGEVEVVENAYVLCQDGLIASVGRMRDLDGVLGDDRAEIVELDGRGLCAIPGLVDCHTHACFAGDRVDEFELRASGASYEELHAAGAGILATVRATRGAGAAGLADAVRRHRDWMRRAGTTTFEAKSGYGLDRDTELASLSVIRAAGGIPTWLGAHAVPPEFGDADAYLDFALAEVLPEASQLAVAADVFVEAGAFDIDQARRYLEACRAAGLTLRLHGDQFTELGAIALAIELGARSVDHLEATGVDGVRALAASDVAAVLLPASALYLGRPMPPARALVDAGAVVALATDFNPGSAFCESLPVVASLAVTQLRLTPGEALAACTVNAAHILGRGTRIGRIEPRQVADLVLLDAPDWRYLAYHLGGLLVAAVIEAGEVSWRAEMPLADEPIGRR